MVFLKDIGGKTCSFFRLNLCHVTPQINHLRNMSPVLRVSTHMYGVSKEIDGKTFIFQTKPRHVTPQIDRLGKYEPCSEGFNTHLWGF